MKSLTVPRWLRVSYEEKKLIGYLVGCATTVYSVYLLCTVGSSFSSADCSSFATVYNLEMPLVVAISILHFIVTGTFFFGIWRENAKCLLPYFCLLVASVGFLGHAHIERLLFEVHTGDRNFVTFAFIWTTAIFTFISAMTLLLYREMNAKGRKDELEGLLLEEKR